MSVLTFDGVVKRFGDFTSLKNLSFDVPEGGIFGFLGGNGAGKTTSLRLALNILKRDDGDIRVLGRPPSRENASRMGFLPEERGLYRQMTVADSIIYFGQLKGMSAAAATKSAHDLIGRFGLSGWAGTKIEALSKGMAQKVQLATALVNAPKLLLLDEPFSGLDPVNQSVLEEIILGMAQGGATIIFSTHVMQHAERLCDRLLVLSRGAKAFEGTLAQARLTIPPRLLLSSRNDPAGLPHVAATTAKKTENGWTDWDVALKPGADPCDVLEAATAQSFLLRRFSSQTPSLHDVFIHLVGAEETRS